MSNNLRVLLVKAFCPFCRVTLTPTARNNLLLSPQKRIGIVDAFERENFRMKLNPIIEKVKFDSYPTLIFDGLKIRGFLSKSDTKACLDALTHDDKIVPDENKFEIKAEEEKIPT